MIPNSIGALSQNFQIDRVESLLKALVSDRQTALIHSRPHLDLTLLGVGASLKNPGFVCRLLTVGNDSMPGRSLSGHPAARRLRPMRSILAGIHLAEGKRHATTSGTGGLF